MNISAKYLHYKINYFGLLLENDLTSSTEIFTNDVVYEKEKIFIIFNSKFEKKEIR